MAFRHILQVTALVMLLCDSSMGGEKKGILETLRETVPVETKHYNGFTLDNSLVCHMLGWPPMSEDELDTTFYLFTPSKRGVAVKPGDMDTMLASGFNGSRPTRIFTHGFIDDSEGYGFSSFEIYLAFLDVEQANVIGVDWRNGARDLTDYPFAAQNARVVGYQIAIFAEALGQDWDKIYLAGHSLGAHASGYAGEALQKKFGVTAPRITGLDPAGPGYTPYDDARCRLDPSDAHFVDNIHTNTILYGSVVPMGHVDVYPNGGRKQPGCDVLRDVGSCSHSRVKPLYAESIRATHCKFTAYPCGSWDDYVAGGCVTRTLRDHTCVNYMGYHVTKSCPGIFYLETGGHKPFCSP